MKMKIQNLLKKWAFGASSLVLLLVGLSAFRPTPNPPTPPPTQTVSYQLDVKQYYLLGEGTDIQQLSPLELSELDQTTMSWYVERSTLANGEQETMITLLDTELNESWMPDLRRITINANGIDAYSTNGELLISQEHSPEALELIEQLTSGAFSSTEMASVSFAPLSPLAMQSIQQSGATVSTPNDHTVHVTKGDRAMIYDYENYSIERQQLERNTPIAQIKVEYYPFDNGTNFMPKLRTERTATKTRLGRCVERIQTVAYTNYRINGQYMGGYAPITTPNTSETTEAFAEKIRVYPNPVQDILQVQLPPLYQDNETIILEIIDLTGSSIYQKTVLPDDSYATLKVEHLPKGVYFVKASQDKLAKVRQFIKQ